MSDYILWVEEDKNFYIKDAPNKLVSLDSLSEEPVSKPNVKAKPFDRAKNTDKVLLELYTQIDETDYLIRSNSGLETEYTNTLRERLGDKTAALDKKAKTLTNEKIRGLKSLLLELRQQQYVIKEALDGPTVRPPECFKKGSFERSGLEIGILPLGPQKGREDPLVKGDSAFCGVALPLSEDSERRVSDDYWERKKSVQTAPIKIDFRNPEVIATLIRNAKEYEQQTQLNEIFETLDYYISRTYLNEIQRYILKAKFNGVKNSDIAAYVNKNFGTSYTVNYISTIYRQNICSDIAATAIHHEKVMENVFYKENFKKCTKCHRLLLIDADNFVRKKKSKDGFVSHCKHCDRKARLGL